MFYRDWGCIQTVGIFVAAILPGIWFVVKRDHTAARKALLRIKEEIATMFMDVVIIETQRLIKIVDEHLPDALSQARSENPLPTRFDHFCASLKEMSDDESDRRKYRGIIIDSFARILQTQIERLIKPVSPGIQTVATRSENPTGLRFELEGETGLKLTFLARKTVRAEFHEKWYELSHAIAMFGFILAAIAGILFLMMGFFVRGKWGNVASIGSLVAFMSLGIVGLVGLLIFARCEAKLKLAAQKCEEDPGFRKAFRIWKGI